MRRLWVAIVVSLAALAGARAEGQQGDYQEFPFFTSTAAAVAVSGGHSWRYVHRPLSVAGRHFEDGGYLRCEGGGRSRGSSVTFDVRGWDRLVGFYGVPDGYVGVRAATYSIEVDGVPVLRVTARQGQSAEPIDVPITGAQTVTLRQLKSGGVFMRPRLVKSYTVAPAVYQRLEEPSRERVESSPLPSPADSPAVPAGTPFAVDARDLKSLADVLREDVDSDPAVAAKVARGHLAVTAFQLIDIPSDSVALNVREDLTTALIKAKFQLVERGQLDRVLKELKIENSGTIDPATAEQIGQLSGCGLILLGSVSDRGQFVVVNARLVETATGRSVIAEQVEMHKMPIGRSAW